LGTLQLASIYFQVKVKVKPSTFNFGVWVGKRVLVLGIAHSLKQIGERQIDETPSKRKLWSHP